MTTTPAPSISTHDLIASGVGPFATTWVYSDAADVTATIEVIGSLPAPLTQGVDYTLTAAAPLVSGGSVTLSIARVPLDGWPAGARLILRRRTSRRQATALPDTEGHKPRATERALDRQMRIAQEDADDLSRALRLPVGLEGGDLPWAPGDGERFITIGPDGRPKSVVRPEDFQGGAGKAGINGEGIYAPAVFREAIGADMAVQLSDFASAGAVEARIAAAYAEADDDMTIMVPRGTVLDHRGAPAVALSGKRVIVDFNGARLIPSANGVTYQGGNGFRAKNVRITSPADQLDPASVVFRLAGETPRLKGIYAERQHTLVDYRGGNGLKLDAHIKNAAPGARSVIIGADGYAGPVDLTLFFNADPGHDNVADCGVLIRRGDVIKFHGGEILQQTTNVLVEPDGAAAGGDHFAALLYFIGTVIDTAVRGVVFRPINGASVIRPQIIGGWYGVMAQEGLLFDATGGTINDVQILAPEIRACGTGIRTLGPVTDLTITEPVVRDCTVGVDFSAGTTGRMTGGSFGGNVMDAAFGGLGIQWREPDGQGVVGASASGGVLPLPNQMADVILVSAGAPITSIAAGPAWANRTLTLRAATTLIVAGAIQVAKGVAVLAPEDSITLSQVAGTWVETGRRAGPTRSGVASVTTNASGDFTIDHGLGFVPTVSTLSAVGTGFVHLQRSGFDATKLTGRAFGPGGAALATTALNIEWTAR